MRFSFRLSLPAAPEEVDEHAEDDDGNRDAYQECREVTRQCIGDGGDEKDETDGERDPPT